MIDLTNAHLLISLTSFIVKWAHIESAASQATGLSKEAASEISRRKRPSGFS
jgi:hypothetical protein